MMNNFDPVMMEIVQNLTADNATLKSRVAELEGDVEKARASLVEANFALSMAILAKNQALEHVDRLLKNPIDSTQNGVQTKV